MIDSGGPDGKVTYRRVAIAATPWGELTLWWIDAYGGGLFVPVRDGTCCHETYGGGRYLTDTVKGTHGRGLVWLGDGRVRLDMNYLYNPSCAFDSSWLCPARARVPGTYTAVIRRAYTPCIASATAPGRGRRNFSE